MAIFHHLYSTIKRGSHTCAVATAAYRSGSHLKLRVLDSSTGEAKEYGFDFSNKSGIGFSAIMAPDFAPQWVFDRQSLWQQIEDVDSAFDADLAREFTIAVPEEFSAEQNINLIKEFVNTSIVGRGLVADVNFHNDHLNNTHAHIMCPLRTLEQNEAGDVFFGKVHPALISQSILDDIQKEQAEIINKYLDHNGFTDRVSHLPDQTPRYDQFRPWL